MSKYNHITKDLLEPLVNKNLSLAEIGKSFNLEPYAVKRLLDKHGLKTVRAEHGSSIAYSFVDKNLLINLVDLGLSEEAIANELGVGVVKAHRILKYHGLKTKFSEIGRKPNYEELSHSTCIGCKQVKEISSFRKSKNDSGNVKPFSYCISCEKDKSSEGKRFALQYRGNCCAICKYDRCIGALEFHHIDSSQKDFEISVLINKKFDPELLKQELDKCVVICNRCHREVHLGVTKLPETIGAVNDV